ncbi:cytochrome c oxidase cbb3-type subunit 3 [Tenacibaculum adriaticum]|uniref:Cytochrome c oxidase cbb3-type subunit 3 n=1 Tax=Tenacibaculum adriaticum TaxID=413713 RepID=A0A5S5DNT1_9FLAO|nr:cbb3-type cytochrome c oxidase N-terminal domain-containing protein [Tenacibaculum adriaticum]TYP97385.1 cytochrome c oxidase cbb3-type subunit 3 [Tenacibaculum adriaticum]
MKKYFQSLGYIIFLGVSSYAIITAIKSYEKPFSLYENPLVWIALVAVVLVVLLKEFLNITALQQAEKLRMEKDGITPEEVDIWAGVKKIIKRWTKARALEEESEIILDHNYDGIKELDNSLPPWWLYMFYATIIFGVVYLVRYHVLGADNQATEYNKEMAEARMELQKYQATSPNVFDISTVTQLTDASDLTRGKAVFNLNCAACHAPDGGGGIGPNLTDKHWILGGGFKNAFNTIYNGGRDGKGMVAWSKTLKPNDIQKVASYVLSLQGTTPAKPKDPQGDIWVENTVEEVSSKDSIK